MKKHSSIRKKFVASLSVFTLACTVLISGILTPIASAATSKTVTLNRGARVYYGSENKYTYTFSVSTGGKTYGAYCGQPTTSAPADGSQHTASQLDSTDKNNRIKLMIYANEHYDSSSYAKNFIDNNLVNYKKINATDKSQRYAWAHAVIGYIYEGNTSSMSAENIEGVKTVINNLGTEISTKSGVWAEAYYYNLYGYHEDGYQDMFWVEDASYGKINIQKCDAKTKECKAASGKSFAGITFTITNASGKEIAYNSKFYANGATIGTVTTKADGTASITKLPAGTYTVKETKTNKYYQLTAGSQNASISNGNTVSLKFYNQPVVEYSLSTTLASKDGDSKTIKSYDEVTLVDKVSYCAEAGKTYIISGKLVNGKGEDLNIEGTTNSVKITPKSDCGTAEVEFTFNASKLAGQKIVAFETLYNEDKSKELSNHADVNDANQTVSVIKKEEYSLATTLSSKDGGAKTIENPEKVTLVDKVSYCAEAGKNYVISGKLVNEKGEDLNIEGTTNSIKITPSADCGTAEVEFTFDASTLAGQKVVAFETLYNEDESKELAKHADVNDANQIVSFTKKVEETPEELPKTGAANIMVGVIGLSLIAIAGGAYINSRKIIKNKMAKK